MSQKQIKNEVILSLFNETTNRIISTLKTEVTATATAHGRIKELDNFFSKRKKDEGLTMCGRTRVGPPVVLCRTGAAGPDR